MSKSNAMMYHTFTEISESFIIIRLLMLKFFSFYLLGLKMVFKITYESHLGQCQKLYVRAI